MAQAYIGIIVKEKNHTERINRAVWAIHAQKDTRVSAVSRIYKTLPPNDAKHPFFTAAARIETDLSAEALYWGLLEVKKTLGQAPENDDCATALELLTFEGFEGALANGIILPQEKLLNRPDILAALLSIYNDANYRKRFRALDDGSVRVTGDGLYLPL